MLQRNAIGPQRVAPRLLTCRRYDENCYLVETTTSSWLIARDDEEGIERVGAMIRMELIRMELNGRAAGNC